MTDAPKIHVFTTGRKQGKTWAQLVACQEENAKLREEIQRERDEDPFGQTLGVLEDEKRALANELRGIVALLESNLSAVNRSWGTEGVARVASAHKLLDGMALGVADGKCPTCGVDGGRMSELAMEFMQVKDRIVAAHEPALIRCERMTEVANQLREENAKLRADLAEAEALAYMGDGVTWRELHAKEAEMAMFGRVHLRMEWAKIARRGMRLARVWALQEAVAKGDE